MIGTNSLNIQRRMNGLMLKRWRPLNCLLWVIGLGVLNLFNLACTEVTETNSSNSISPQITVEIVEIEAQDEMTQLVEKELTRARILLAPERTKTEWVEVPLAHRPESVGALGGFGVKTTDPDVFGSVYVFEEWGAGAKVSWELLEADVPTEGTRT
ncbi:MAG: hypothetical protein ACPG8W_14555, partial [Candidatus Promineifilaceae bacterium]